jgi:large subunit ribosomal protein L10
MSKKVKNLITRELGEKFRGVDSVAVINPRGINATKNNGIRRRLREKNLRMTVVKNTLAVRAVGDGKLKGFEKLLDGPSAVIYGEASIATIARLILEEKKTDEKIELRGIFFDGEVYAGDAGVKQVSVMPTREEAIGQIVSALLGAGSSILSALLGPGMTVASLVKAIEEKAEKSGGGDAVEAAPAVPAEAIAPAAAPAPAGEPPAAT